MESGQRSTVVTSGPEGSGYSLNRAWEGLCTLCICGPCGANPVHALKLISFVSFVGGVGSLCIGIWLAVLVLLNGSLKLRDQLYFEKLQISESGSQDYFNNESSFILTPIQNLNFYLLAISSIAILGGIGRIIASLSLYVYYYRKKTVSGLVSWSWVISSMLSVVSLCVLTVDTLYTLSHNDLTPPHNRDFYFQNDRFRFYFFCHTLKWFIALDFLLTTYFQWTIRWFHRSQPFTNHLHNIS